MNRNKYINTVSRRTVLGSVGVAASFALGANELPDAKASAANTIQWPTLHLVNGPDLKPGDWAGLPAILVFWETWCPYCKRHNARVEQLYQATMSKKMRVMGATTETDEAKVKSYVASSQLHFPVAMVTPDFRAQFTKRKVIPLTCLVSAAGNLMQVIPGEMTQEDVLALATQVMGGSPKISNT
jgi:thiol-disulfide isomerase/thioredoxin